MTSDNVTDWWAPWGADEHCRVWIGTAPLLLSLPHDGVEIPTELQADLTADSVDSPDSDWHVARLYDFARELGASVLRPRWSRYVVDLNRPPDGAALYPGRRETGLCPLQRFDGAAIYRPGREPDHAAVVARALRYWQPYHQTLQAQLQRLRALHPAVLLWDGHSIRSHCPMFFDGRLPDYNIGTADGASCDSAIQDALAQNLRGAGQSFVVNGRFKGGYITRHFGAPASGIHAVQMEMAQASYLDETQPAHYLPALAQDAQAVLRRLLQTALAVLPSA